MRIGMIGGDARSLVCALCAKQYGHEVVGACFPDGGLPCDTVEAVCDFAEVLVLPVPAMKDGVHITGTSLSPLSLPLRQTTRVFGGAFSPMLRQFLAERAWFDCMQDEVYQKKNALLTAQGGVAAALMATGRGLYGLSAAVIGYGRIGSLLAHLLQGLGVPTRVYARSPVARAEAACRGLLTGECKESFTIEEDMVFNTVPAAVFDRVHAPHAIFAADLGNGSGTGMILPEGVHMDIMRGVPGVFSPQAAGEILYDALQDYLDSLA